MEAKIEIELTARAIDLCRELPAEFAAAAGARVEFAGNVRGEENGRAIAALEYEAYAPMAGREMRRILEDILQRHECLFVRVTHRTGIVPVSEAAVHIVALARHRAAALALVPEFMDRLKQDVPIWKGRALSAAELKPI